MYDELLKHFGSFEFEDRVGRCVVCKAKTSPVIHNYRSGASIGRAFCIGCATQVRQKRKQDRQPYIDLTEKEEKALRAYLDTLSKSSPRLFEYWDNFRIARIGNDFQMALYEFFDGTGCCGFYDTEIDLDGSAFKIGWNYGH